MWPQRPAVTLSDTVAGRIGGAMLDFGPAHPDTGAPFDSERLMSEREPLRQRLRTGLTALNLELDDAVVGQLLDYVDLLLRWNAAYNLTAVRDAGRDGDPPSARFTGDPALRAGTLAGRPGHWPGPAGHSPGPGAAPSSRSAWSTRMARRRASCAKRFVNCTWPMRGSSKAASRAPAALSDCVTARAFATLADMLGWGGICSRGDGRWLALKGRFPQDELDDLPAGFVVEAVHRLVVPGLDAERHLVIIKRSADGSAARKPS